MKFVSMTAAALAVICSGCSSNLVVHDGQTGALVPGMPIRTAEVYVVQGMHTAHSKLTSCTPTPFTKNISLPTGALYFLNAKSDALVSTEFSLTFSEQGVLTGLTMNSEPAAQETLEGVSTFATTALFPILGIAGAKDDGADSKNVRQPHDKPSGPACDSGETNISIRRLTDFSTD